MLIPFKMPDVSSPQITFSGKLPVFLTFNNLLFLLKEMTVIFLTVVAREQDLVM